jgi:hypothetical protein
MKKLFLISAMILIVISGYSQKTSDDVKAQILTIIGEKMTKMTPELRNLYYEYNKLHVKELRNIPQSNKYTIVPDVTLKSCFVCICSYCGRIIVTSQCGTNPPYCGLCAWDNYPTDDWVMSCEGGMCGNIIGKN